MNYKDILAMASAYKQVAEKKTLDPVDAKELKGKHKDRKDKDIDNDGDVDKSDEYLHKRRKAVSASIKGQKKGTEVETEVQEMTKAQKRALQGIKAQPKDKVSLKKAPWDKKETKESVEEIDEATVKQQKALKALMTKALGGKRAKPGTTSAVATNGDFVVKDGGSRIIGRIKAGEFQDPLKEEIDEAKLMTQAERIKALNKSSKAKMKSNLVKLQKAGKTNEEVEELDENKAIIKHYQDMKAQGKKDHHILDYIGSMPKYKKVSRDQMAKMIGDAKRKGIFKEDLDLDEAKDHGNMNNGSPRGEGLSPSAKKELDRTTPMNPATDELAVNNLNFKTFKAMTKKAPKRSADNDAGDKKAIASATSVKEELDLSDFTQEEIIDFMMTEDFAQLDELSKNTLSSYLKKAAKSKNSAIDKADRIKYNNAGTGSEMAPRSKKALDKNNKTIDKRTKGIGSFMKRDQAKANPEYVHKPSATDRYKDGSAPSMTNKPASALHKSYKDRK